MWCGQKKKEKHLSPVTQFNSTHQHKKLNITLMKAGCCAGLFALGCISSCKIYLATEWTQSYYRCYSDFLKKIYLLQLPLHKLTWINMFQAIHQGKPNAAASKQKKENPSWQNTLVTWHCTISVHIMRNHNSQYKQSLSNNYQIITDTLFILQQDYIQLLFHVSEWVIKTSRHKKNRLQLLTSSLFLSRLENIQ